MNLIEIGTFETQPRREHMKLIDIGTFGGYTVRRASESRTSSRALKPEHVTITKVKSGIAVSLHGQDAEDFLDQLTHARDMKQICAETWADPRWSR